MARPQQKGPSLQELPGGLAASLCQHGEGFLQERQRACSQAGTNDSGTVTLPCVKSLSTWEAEEYFNPCLVKFCGD